MNCSGGINDSMKWVMLTAGWDYFNIYDLHIYHSTRYTTQGKGENKIPRVGTGVPCYADSLTNSFIRECQKAIVN